MTKKPKPLSPHLTIYKPQISSVLSIMHRISGVVNFFGVAMLMWWLLYKVYFGLDYSMGAVHDFFNQPFCILILVLWSFSLFFHFCTGIRHLCWDVGLGFDVQTMNRTGWVAVGAALVLTLATWIIVFMGV